MPYNGDDMTMQSMQSMQSQSFFWREKWKNVAHIIIILTVINNNTGNNAGRMHLGL